MFKFIGKSGREYLLPMNEGPGKYEGELGVCEALCTLTLDGCGEECGNVSEVGWHASLIDGPVSRDELEGGPILSTHEYSALGDIAGAIVAEDSQGFVSLTLYADERKLAREWDELVKVWEATFEGESYE